MERLLRSLPSGGIALLLLAAFCLSLTNVAAPFVYRAGGNAQTILVLRYAGFLPLCGLWLIWRGGFRWLDRRGQLVCLGAGTAYALGAGALLMSLAFLPVSLAILILFTFPFWTALMEDALERRLPSLGRIACLALALGGLVLALEVERFALDSWGVALASFAAFGVAVSYVWTGRGLAGEDSAVMTFHMAITGLAVALLLAFGTAGIALPAGGGGAGGGTDGVAGWAALWVSVLGFAGAFFAMFRGVQLIGPAPTAMAMNLEPVFTIALSAAFLAESLSGRKLLGAAAVILAVVASQILSARREGALE